MKVLTHPDPIHKMEHWGEVRACVLVAKQSAKGIGCWSGRCGGSTGAGVGAWVECGVLGLEQERGQEILCPEWRWQENLVASNLQPHVSGWSQNDTPVLCPREEQHPSLLCRFPMGIAWPGPLGVGEPCHWLLPVLEVLLGPQCPWPAPGPLRMKVRTAGFQALRKDCQTGKGFPAPTQEWLTG